MKIADHPRLLGSARPYVAGALLMLSGVAYLGALTDDPTHPAPIALLLAIPAFWGSVRSFTRGNLRTVKRAISYGLAMPWVVLALGSIAAWRIGVVMLLAGFAFSACAWMALAGVHPPQPPDRHPGHTKHQ